MLRDPKTIFNALAEQYDAYRPHYPQDALLFLITSAELDRTSDVADIGTGTGRIALELAKYVRVVYAVDTASGMLEQLNIHAREEGLSNIRTIEASAEDTRITSGSLALAVMSQSFHWLDKPASLQEVHRILAEEKPLVVMWNQITNTSDTYYQEITALIKEHNPNYRGGSDIVSVDFKPSIEQSGLFDTVEKFSFPFELQYSPEAYLGFLLSKSYVGVGIAQDKLQHFLERVHEILKEHFPSGVVGECYETVLLIAKKRVI